MNADPGRGAGRVRRVEWFDSHVGFGPVLGSTPDFRRVADLLREMDRCGIARALVWSTLARDHDPMEGNRGLSRAIGDEERLRSCWILVPPGSGGIPSWRSLARAMRGNGVGAVRLFPMAHGYSLAPWCAEDLVRFLAEHRIVTFVDREQTPLGDLAAMLEAEPGWRVVLSGTGYREGRAFYALLRRFPSLRIDTSYWPVGGVLGDLVRRFGPDRILFGTRLPWYEPGPAMTLVAFAELSAEDRSAVAGGTLARLLEEAAW